MDPKYWKQKWESADTQFHQRTVNPYLLKYEKLIPERSIVFVPLCGKSGDMEWLVKKGYHVVGSELSPIACKDFFAENKRSFETEVAGAFTKYVSPGITIYCGDHLALTKDHVKGVSAVYDRAALVALPPAIRKKYAEHLISLLSAAHPLDVLLLTFEYDQTLVEGPPHAVLEPEVRQLFEPALEVKLLERQETPALHRTNSKFMAVPTVSEGIYHLSR